MIKSSTGPVKKFILNMVCRYVLTSQVSRLSNHWKNHWKNQTNEKVQKTQAKTKITIDNEDKMTKLKE